MRGGKRSAPLVAAALVTFALTSCAAETATTPEPVAGDVPSDSVKVPRPIRQNYKPVGVLSTEADRMLGVIGTPLEPGETLLFSFPEDSMPAWTMRDVSYPLDLNGFDAAGQPVGETVRMKPCPPGRDTCPTYLVETPGRFFTETRPPGS